MSNEPKVMPEKDYLFTIAQEIIGLIEVLEKPPKLSHGLSLNWYGREVANPSGVISSEDKYFLYEFSPSIDSSIGRHIDGWLYTKDFNGNLTRISKATTHVDKPPFSDFVFPDFTERRNKWVVALKEVGGKFGFYYGDREVDVVLLDETATDSKGLERAVNAYCERTIGRDNS